MTVYLGPIEIRKFGQGAVEEMTEYPTPDIRLVRKIVSGVVTTEKTTLHRDGLGSVRAVTLAAGLRTETSSYRPFGPSSPRPPTRSIPPRRKASSASASMPTPDCIAEKQGK